MQADADSTGPFDYDVVRLSQKDGDRVATLKAQRLSMGRRLVRLREAFLSGVDTMDEYRQAKEEVTEAIQKIDEAIAAANAENRRVGNPNIMRSAIRDALAVITDESATLEQRCTAAHSIIDHITWDKAQNLLTIHYRLLLD